MFQSAYGRDHFGHPALGRLSPHGIHTEPPRAFSHSTPTTFIREEGGNPEDPRFIFGLGYLTVILLVRCLSPGMIKSPNCRLHYSIERRLGANCIRYFAYSLCSEELAGRLSESIQADNNPEVSFIENTNRSHSLNTSGR